MIDQDTRAALEQHWAASDAGDSRPSTTSILTMQYWNIPSPASEFAADATSRPPELSGQQEALPGSPNTWR